MSRGGMFAADAFRRGLQIVGGLALCAALTGCPPPSYTLRMSSTLAPVDTSSISPKLKSRKYTKIMIIPPSGTIRGEFDTTISLIEKEFINRGITPINGAITGRVVMAEQGEKGGKKDEGAQSLSDAERALIMANDTGADALLQIGQFGWSTDSPTTRYFNITPQSTEHTYSEVSLEEFQSFNGPKRSYRSPWFTFIGRLTDVKTGEVMASFKVEGASNWNLPSDYVAEITGDSVVSENFVYSQTWLENGGVRSEAGEWINTANELTLERVIAKVAENILSQ